MRRTTIFAVAVLLLAATTMSAHAATITVTNTNDSGPGSLRQALAVAHHGDRITFAVSGTITLTSGALVVTKNVTISGPGANQLSIDGNQGTYVFFVDTDATIATISGLTIRNGVDGIGKFGTLTVSNCVLSGNSAVGIASFGGTLTVSNCVVSGNSYGIANNGHNLTVVNSNVSDNGHSGISFTAPNFVVVTATIRSTTVRGNLEGGIVANVGGFGTQVHLTITDCTISGNSRFGGIHAEGAPNLTVTNSTISGNSANAGFPAGDRGGGISGQAHYQRFADTGRDFLLQTTIPGDFKTLEGVVWGLLTLSSQCPDKQFSSFFFPDALSSSSQGEGA